MAKFNVTYENITPESAEHGDAESRGFIAQGVTLREALEQVTLGSHVEANCSPVADPHWFTFYAHNYDYITGETENRSLHLPDSLTESSKQRIAKFIGCSNAWSCQAKRAGSLTSRLYDETLQKHGCMYG